MVRAVRTDGEEPRGVAAVVVRVGDVAEAGRGLDPTGLLDPRVLEAVHQACLALRIGLVCCRCGSRLPSVAGVASAGDRSGEISPAVPMESVVRTMVRRNLNNSLQCRLNDPRKLDTIPAARRCG